MTPFLLGLGQMLSYCLITINMRAITSDRLGLALATDLMLQSVSFFAIRKISHTDDSIKGWAGYTTGGLIGTWLGMRVFV